MNKVEQNLFLTDDCTRMIEYVDDEVHIYDIERLTDNPECVNCQATYKHRVQRIPLGIYDEDPYQLYCLFSPNFLSHLDINPINSTFVIRDCFSGNILFEIPETFLNFDRKLRNKIVM